MPKLEKGKSLGKLATKANVKECNGPLWKGPMDSSPLGGITQSAINNFLVCRERFRLKMVEGMQPPERFSAPLDFGSMWHICEEIENYEQPLKEYAQRLCLKFPLQQEEIHKWWQVVKLLHPIYKEYWAKHQTKEKVEPLMREQTFNVPYELPSGRVVYLRGKFDGVDLAGTGKDRGIYLFETKTKSDIEESKIVRTLKLDLQTMLYLIALAKDKETRWGLLGANEDATNNCCSLPIKGVRYNCIRRPLSGGKGTIRPHQATKTKPAESNAEYFARLKGVILEDVDTYFLRLKVEVFPSDVERFKRISLNPILEQMCGWYEHVCQDDLWDNANHIHYVSPFGLYNPLTEMNQTDMDELILNGSEVGLQKVDSLFPELQG
jgi:hypothetical protein